MAIQQRRNGINPITIRGALTTSSQEKVNITIGRLWTMRRSEAIPAGQHRHGQDVPAPEDLQKTITILLWNGPDDSPIRIGQMCVDEDKFLEGLKHLFPNGELEETPP